MIAVQSVDTTLTLMKEVKNLKKGFLTNFFLDPGKTSLWINLNIFNYEQIGDTFFLFRKNGGFQNLFYISTQAENLLNDIKVLTSRYPEETFVTDVVGRIADINKIEDLFLANCFYRYTSLVRMSALTAGLKKPSASDGSVLYAGLSDVDIIDNLLKSYFDAYAEQLPLREELNNWASNKRILIYREGDNVIEGFLIFDIIGQTSYLRYWFVHPDYREKKIGSFLLNKFFEEGIDILRRLFWVINTNQNAIKRYEHYGFRKEELFDYVLINKNLTYEG